MSKIKKKNDPVIMILDLIIVVLVFMIIAAGVRLYTNKSHEKSIYNLTQNVTFMSYDLEKNDYSSLIQGAYINQINDYNEPAPYHALAHYTEAAVWYKVYDRKGKSAEAYEQKATMENAREAMGSLTVFADRVDVMLRDFGNK